MQIFSGSVSVTTGNNNVIGSTDADWTDVQTALGIGSPCLFSVVGQPEIPYPITSVTPPSSSTSGNWELTLVTNYEGETNAAAPYVIHKDFTPKMGLPLFSAGDSQTAQIINRAFTAIDQLGDALCVSRAALAADVPLNTTLVEIPDLTLLLSTFVPYRVRYGLIVQCTGTGTGISVQQKISLPASGLVKTYAANLRVPIGTPAAGTANFAGPLYIPGSFGPGDVVSNIATATATPAANTQFIAEIEGAITVDGDGSPLRLLVGSNNVTNTLTLLAGSYVVLEELEEG